MQPHLLLEIVSRVYSSYNFVLNINMCIIIVKLFPPADWKALLLHITGYRSKIYVIYIRHIRQCDIYFGVCMYVRMNQGFKSSTCHPHGADDGSIITYTHVFLGTSGYTRERGQCPKMAVNRSLIGHGQIGVPQMT